MAPFPTTEGRHQVLYANTYTYMKVHKHAH